MMWCRIFGLYRFQSSFKEKSSGVMPEGAAVTDHFDLSMPSE